VLKKITTMGKMMHNYRYIIYYSLDDNSLKDLFGRVLPITTDPIINEEN